MGPSYLGEIESPTLFPWKPVLYLSRKAETSKEKAQVPVLDFSTGEQGSRFPLGNHLGFSICQMG